MKEKNNQIIIFRTEDGKVSVDVRFDDDTVWLTIDQMAELFEKSRSTINEHILNVYSEGELEESVSKRKIGISDFSTKPTNHYNIRCNYISRISCEIITRYTVSAMGNKAIK